MDNRYELENGIEDMCNKKLKELEKNNLSIVSPDIKINVDYLWESWICLRSKSIYNDTLAMNIENIDDMTEQAIWEYNKGSKIKA